MHFCIIERKSFEIIASNGQNLNFLFNVPHGYQGSFKICVKNYMKYESSLEFKLSIQSVKDKKMNISTQKEKIAIGSPQRHIL